MFKVPFATASKRTKYNTLILTKELQDVRTEKHKTLKEIKEDIKKWESILFSWFKRLMMRLFHKLIFRFNTISTKILVVFFSEIEKLILKFLWKHKRTRIAKIILERRNKSGGLTFLNFKTYYKPTVI